jgi:soluble calcium-activated nucleotidase 1
LVDDDSTDPKVVDIHLKENEDRLKGFSSFAFFPGTKDEHAIAIHSMEENCTGDLDLCKQRSFFVVFNVLTDEVLSDKIRMPDDQKFEGIKFVNIYSKASS